uniref:Uncharacterized protein n=1 Tax=Anguilla anguilla TaxID=7936 RepID=A0A0E9TQK2_ANGAN
MSLSLRERESTVFLVVLFFYTFLNF